ncbi:ABC transporter permease [Brevibacillus borstelensis]|uniref:ABC transporter permease n=1 Tax=Brevibacillus borstelensis TaxID=45462 RepID=UPI0030BFE3A7
MWRFFRSELLKLRKSPIWLLVFVSPALSTVIGLGMRIDTEMEEMAWGMTYATMAVSHALLFLPLLTGVLSAFVCRYEHVGGGWKQMLALPVSRGTVYVVKFAMVMGLLLLAQCLLLAGLLAVGAAKGFSASIPWDILIRSLVSSWVACMPLAALQLAVSVAWSSFAAPMAVNAIFTLPNILLVNSEKYGPWYPWAQPMLAMLPQSQAELGMLGVPQATLFIVILGSFAVFFVSGFVYFQRKMV